MHPIFLEIIMAPQFTQEALDVLTTKKNLRLLEVDMHSASSKQMQYVSVNGGLLAQQLDTETITLKADMCVTDTKPTDEQMTDMQFGWRIVKHVKSNAIVVVKNGRTYGVGAGQMNRVGSAAIALKQAQETLAEEGKDIKQAGLVMASDGFFPFGDSVESAAEYGIAAIVQPGGSVRDSESIEAANQHRIPMLFTGMRHFKH
jgi:phosphoribosylaminoimidazolecarboxamide formyltransferase/IMP cyclohydrolase